MISLRLSSSHSSKKALSSPFLPMPKPGLTPSTCQPPPHPPPHRRLLFCFFLGLSSSLIPPTITTLGPTTTIKRNKMEGKCLSLPVPLSYYKATASQGDLTPWVFGWRCLLCLVDKLIKIKTGVMSSSLFRMFCLHEIWLSRRKKIRVNLKENSFLLLFCHWDQITLELDEVMPNALIGGRVRRAAPLLLYAIVSCQPTSTWNIKRNTHKDVDEN